MNDIIRVIEKFKPFILGKCQCGCGEDIPIRSRKYKILRKFKHQHHHRVKKECLGVRFLHKGNNYWMLYLPDYFSSKQGVVYEHVYFYQEYYKVCVLPWTHIHHIEPVLEGYCNNMPWNLEAIINTQHPATIHLTKDMSGRRCSECDSDKTYIRKNNGRPEWRSDKKGGWWCSICRGKILRNGT